MDALLRYSRVERPAIARKWAKRSNTVQSEKRKSRDLDKETLSWRARQDRRGELIREGVSWTGDSLKPWKIVRSVRGRINQVDLVVGDWIRTGSMRVALAALKTGKWKA